MQYKRTDAPARGQEKWISCGKLTCSEDGEKAFLFAWMLPPPCINTRTGQNEVKAICRPHPDKAKLAGSLPSLDGDIMMMAERFVDEFGKVTWLKRKVGYILSRENEVTHDQYYVLYFLGQPLVRMTDEGGVWMSIHLDVNEDG